MPDPVPGVLCFCIGFIFTVLYPVFTAIGFNSVSCCEKQWSDDIVAGRSHSCKTHYSSSPGQVYQESFNIIIEIMANSGYFKSFLLPYFFEPPVSQISGSHLDRNSFSG